MSWEEEKKVTKLILVLATSTLVIEIREKTTENAENSKIDENDEKGKYLRTNFAQVAYI